MGKTGVIVLMAIMLAVSIAVCCCHQQAFISDQTEPGDAARNLMQKARNTAAKAKDSVSSAASKASKFTSEKTGEAANEAFETASDLKDDASDKMDQFIRTAGSNQLEKAMEYGKEKASGAYDEMRAFDDSRHRVSEAYDSAKNLMSEEAKATYEPAKEKLSEATGAVGDKMRNDKEEL